jgi:hypothetical protein
MSDIAPVLNTTSDAYPLSASQVAMANLIVEEFLAAGFGYPVAAAAVVNAFRESSFNAKKSSETGRYVGLFQLSPDILASVEDRQDPRKNTQAIIGEAKRSKSFMEAAAFMTDIPFLAGEFAYYVERPLDRSGERKLRYEIAEVLYPPDTFWENSEEALTPRAPPYTAPVGFIEDPDNKPIVLLGVLGFVTAALVALRLAEKRRRAWAQTPAAGSLRRSLPR